MRFSTALVYALEFVKVDLLVPSKQLSFRAIRIANPSKV